MKSIKLEIYKEPPITIGSESRDDKIKRLTNELEQAQAELKRRDDMASRVGESMKFMKCINDKTHESFKGCLYCELEQAQAELLKVTTAKVFYEKKMTGGLKRIKALLKLYRKAQAELAAERELLSEKLQHEHIITCPKCNGKGGDCNLCCNGSILFEDAISWLQEELAAERKKFEYIEDNIKYLQHVNTSGYAVPSYWKLITKDERVIYGKDEATLMQTIEAAIKAGKE